MRGFTKLKKKNLLKISAVYLIGNPEIPIHYTSLSQVEQALLIMSNLTTLFDPCQTFWRGVYLPCESKNCLNGLNGLNGSQWSAIFGICTAEVCKICLRVLLLSLLYMISSTCLVLDFGSFTLWHALLYTLTLKVLISNSCDGLFFIEHNLKFGLVWVRWAF